MTTSGPGYGAQQILDVIVAPADSGAQEERVRLARPVQEVVPASRHEYRRREVIPRGELPVRGVVGPGEIEKLRGKAEAILQGAVVDRRASARLDDAGAARPVAQTVTEERGDRELILELLAVDRRNFPVAIGKRPRLLRDRAHAAAGGLGRDVELVELR